jgi:predicted amidophosphoribosyltransferase
MNDYDESKQNITIALCVVIPFTTIAFLLLGFLMKDWKSASIVSGGVLGFCLVFGLVVYFIGRDSTINIRCENCGSKIKCHDNGGIAYNYYCPKCGGDYKEESMKKNIQHKKKVSNQYTDNGNGFYEFANTALKTFTKTPKHKFCAYCRSKYKINHQCCPKCGAPNRKEDK